MSTSTLPPKLEAVAHQQRDSLHVIAAETRQQSQRLADAPRYPGWAVALFVITASIVLWSAIYFLVTAALSLGSGS